MNNLCQLNTSLKEEADDLLLVQGLMPLLEPFGLPHLAGSYALDLMTWRDLDIYLETDQLSEAAFFKLGGRIATALNPVKMHFRNELLAGTDGLPRGLYWGIYLGNEKAGAWKIDVWAIDSRECERLLQFMNHLQQKLTAEKSEYIRHIKLQCWQDPAYRRRYSSQDIYTAVLDQNVSSHAGFEEYLKNKQI